MVALQVLEAAEEGDVHALQAFEKGAVTEDVSDDFGANCLHYAARQGGVDTLTFLVKDRGFTGNRRSNIGSTPAHDAAASGNLETLKWLLKNTPCQTGDQDGIGTTVLHLACRFQHTHVTQWLVEEAGADTMIKTSSGGLPLHFAVVGGDINGVKILLEEDPMSVNLQTDNGATAVYLAAQEGQFEILRLLVQEKRGNVKMKAYDGMSCLHGAAQQGHLDCVRFLVNEEKCSPSERDFDGATPLHYAASRGRDEVLHWMLKEGRGRITLDNLGGSPLHNAAESGHIQCVLTLLKNGCSPAITDNNGLTAEELARKCHHDQCAEIISSYGQQLTDDPDLEYLAEVASPRPSTSAHRLYQPSPQPPSYQGQQPVTFQDLGQRSASPEALPQQTTDSAVPCHQSEETGECESVSSNPSVTRDRQEQPQEERSLRSGCRRSPPLTGDLSSSTSSLSSISYLDEVIAAASADIKNSSAPVKRLHHQEFLAPAVGASAESKPHQSRVTGFSYLPPVSRTQYSHLKASEPEQRETTETQQSQDQKYQRTGVTFHLTESQQARQPVESSISLGQKPRMEWPPADYLSREVVIEEARDRNVETAESDDQVKQDSIRYEQMNGGGLSGLSNGSVTTVPSMPSRPQPGTSSVRNGSPAKTVIPIASSSEKVPPQTTLPAPPAPPPPPPPPTPLTNGSSVPAPPSLPAVLPVTEQNSRADRKPARPTSLVTIEALAEKRNTLTPSSARPTNSRISPSGNPDLIAELKKVAGGSSLRKTAKPGDNPSSRMVFSSNSSKTNGSGPGKQPVKEKDGMEALVGEWDPKHFIDQVPTRDGSGAEVPSWRIQLQARHLAEKTMKETLERRKVEEKEARFKNMPAWKRAIIEKKEAELKPVEEKDGQQKSAKRNVPSVGVSGAQLSPWQQELQENKS